jgi:hypothetical protein
MSDVLKILGQVAPAAMDLTDLYECFATEGCTVSTIFVCNRSASTSKFRISVANGGAVDAIKQYLYYDVELPGNDTFASTVGLSLTLTDIIRVYSESGDLSFSAFGMEID